MNELYKEFLSVKLDNFKQIANKLGDSPLSLNEQRAIFEYYVLGYFDGKGWREDEHNLALKQWHKQIREIMGEQEKEDE